MRKQTGLTYYLTSIRAVKCARLNYTDAFFFEGKKKHRSLYVVLFFMGIAIKILPKNSFPFCVYDLQTSF